MWEPAAIAPLIGELLLRREQIRAEDLDSALRFQAEQGGRIGAVLLRMGAVTADRLFAALSEQLGLGWIRFEALDEAALRASRPYPRQRQCHYRRLQALAWRMAAAGRWRALTR